MIIQTHQYMKAETWAADTAVRVTMHVPVENLQRGELPAWRTFSVENLQRGEPSAWRTSSVGNLQRGEPSAWRTFSVENLQRGKPSVWSGEPSVWRTFSVENLQCGVENLQRTEAYIRLAATGVPARKSDEEDESQRQYTERQKTWHVLFQ